MSQQDGPWTVQRTLEWTIGFFTRKGIDAPRLSAELLLAHVLAVPRIKLYTDYQRPLTDEQRARLRELVTRAAEHEPIAYLTGKAHFFNLEFEVTRDVLIPRPDTETLVENVIQIVRKGLIVQSPRILDLCTGSGCIAAAVAQNLKNAIVVATEINPKTVEIARKNLENLKLTDRVTVEQGDLFEPLGRLVDARTFDLIVSNPPYIPSGQIDSLDLSVRNYEPRQALDGGADGLDFHRRILEKAPEHLSAGGRVLMEIAFDQGAAATQLAAEYERFDDVKTLKDHAGHERVLSIRLKASGA